MSDFVNASLSRPSPLPLFACCCFFFFLLLLSPSYSLRTPVFLLYPLQAPGTTAFPLIFNQTLLLFLLLFLSVFQLPPPPPPLCPSFYSVNLPHVCNDFFPTTPRPVPPPLLITDNERFLPSPHPSPLPSSFLSLPLQITATMTDVTIPTIQ